MTAISSDLIIQAQSVPIAVGEQGIVVGFTRTDLAATLLAMGVLPGSNIRLVRTTPFGSAVYVAIDQHFLALRKNEFEAIVIRK